MRQEAQETKRRADEAKQEPESGSESAHKAEVGAGVSSQPNKIKDAENLNNVNFQGKSN